MWKSEAHSAMRQSKLGILREYNVSATIFSTPLPLMIMTSFLPLQALCLAFTAGYDCTGSNQTHLVSNTP